ncbi:MAG: type IV conjugative transfer system coupling protein TraD, partial [Legionellaceae bacterium]|nr:type IV conjugative transfer system coupling protein TraD [Legionellaceae bacterium]
MANNAQHKHFTRGGQIAFHNLRMFFQINKALFNVHCIIWVLIYIALISYLIPKDILLKAISYEMATIYKSVGKEHIFIIGGSLKQTVHDLITNPYYAQISALCFKELIRCAWLSLGASLFLAVLISWYFIKKGKFQVKNKFIRGSSFAIGKIIKKQIIKSKNNSDITIDGFPLIKDSEVQHLLVHGTVGTGKSQLIMKILDSIRKRGDIAIIYDKGCAFIPHYYNSKDIILNPFDTRCAAWDLWSEAPQNSDLENMAESLIPNTGNSDPFWVNAARVVFIAAASKMREDKGRSLEKLLEILLTSPFETLENYLQGTEAATLVSSKIEKTAISIRSVITTYIKSLQPLIGLVGDEFSIRNYLLDDKKQGWLFISSNGEQHKSLKPLMSMWLAMASMTMLSLPPNSKRRVWFICDELPSLHKLPLLGETIAEVRKFGGCFLLGMQSFSQLEKVYSRSGANEIFDLLNTRFFFRSPSSDMARIVSRELGEEDIDESREQYSYGASSVRDGISLGNQRVSRPIISYPEILELANLACYVRLPGEYPVTKLSLKYENRKIIANSLNTREIRVKQPVVMESLKNNLEKTPEDWVSLYMD